MTRTKRQKELRKARAAGRKAQTGDCPTPGKTPYATLGEARSTLSYLIRKQRPGKGPQDTTGARAERGT